MDYGSFNDPANDHALHDPKIVLRNSLGMLAVQILSTRVDLSEIGYSDMLNELYSIICDLQKTYEDAKGDFT